MYLLSEREIAHWRELGETIIERRDEPEQYQTTMRKNYYPAFCFYIGTLWAARENDVPEGKKWFREGALWEDDGLFSNAFITSFLERQNDSLEMPALCFEDPKPYIHFTTTPIMRRARENFIKFSGHSLPNFSEEFRIMDIGTGNGTLLRDIIKHLLDIGRVKEISEVMLIDSSPAMLEIAKNELQSVVPENVIKTVNSKIQDAAQTLEIKYDVAMSSLAYHHMPYDRKIVHMRELAPHFDHFLLFELDANNDAPEQHSPELACSIYQSYGRIIDYIFSHDAPIQVAENAVDNFLMTEELSFLTQARGERTDYHMLRSEWSSMFEAGLGVNFERLGETTCCSDEYLDLFACHYGRR